jgi:hypothetical protein
VLCRYSIEVVVVRGGTVPWLLAYVATLAGLPLALKGRQVVVSVPLRVRAPDRRRAKTPIAPLFEIIGEPDMPPTMGGRSTFLRSG